MGRREWIVLALFVFAVAGIGAVVALNRPEPSAPRPTGQAEDELFQRMTADPNKAAEDDAVALVTRLGGTIERQQGHPVYQPVEQLSLRDRPVTDAELASLAGLINLRKIDLSGTRVTDTGLRSLLAFRYLGSLDLSRTPVTGKGLTSLKPLTLLTRLTLAGAKVNDMDLQGLTGVPNLTELDLADTELTNRGLDRLTVLPRLDKLNVARTKITGQAVPQLRNLGVAEFDLTGIALSTEEYLGMVTATPRKGEDVPPPGPARPAPSAPPIKVKLLGVNPSITDEAIQALAQRKELSLLVTTLGKTADPALPEPKDAEEVQGDKTVLDLSGSKVTDAGLKHLGDLPSLRRLDLKRTAVTDAGLKQLSALTSLRVLDLRGTQVTDAGVASLQAQLPKCVIAH